MNDLLTYATAVMAAATIAIAFAAGFQAYFSGQLARLESAREATTFVVALSEWHIDESLNLTFTNFCPKTLRLGPMIFRLEKKAGQYSEGPVEGVYSLGPYQSRLLITSYAIRSLLTKLGAPNADEGVRLSLHVTYTCGPETGEHDFTLYEGKLVQNQPGRFSPAPTEPRLRADPLGRASLSGIDGCFRKSPRSLLDSPKELGERNSQRLGNLFDVNQRNVPLPPLDPTHIGLAPAQPMES